MGALKMIHRPGQRRAAIGVFSAHHTRFKGAPMRGAFIAAIVGLLLLGGTERITAKSSGQIVRELRRMTGYTIVDVLSLREIREGRTGKLAVLSDGQVFDLGSSLTLALPFSDVIVFAKPVSAEIRSRYPGLPSRSYYSYRLLIDDEMIDATPE
jgi:hypothetical protein